MSEASGDSPLRMIVSAIAVLVFCALVYFMVQKRSMPPPPPGAGKTMLATP